MSIEALLSGIQQKAATAPALGKTLKFDFGSAKLFVDGTGDSNQVSLDDKDADCTVTVSQEDFAALAKGELNPMTAVMTGKVKISGDMSIAMKLQSLFA